MAGQRARSGLAARALGAGLLGGEGDLHQPGAPRRIRLTVPVQVEGAPRVIEAFTSVGFGQGQLSHFAKGRGLADCGESAAWAFDGQDFRLQRYHRLGWCRGGNPGDWPTLWRTRGD